MPISTTWTSPTRPSATPYTTRPSISGFSSYTWANAPDIWSAVSDTWDTYGTISTGTSWNLPRN